MARIETDPNYTAPTFSRATTATDIFKKEDVQGVAEALSLHDHAVGKGLPVTRLGILNQYIQFTGSKGLSGDNLQVLPVSPNTAGSLSIQATGSATSSTLTLYGSSTTGQTQTAFVQAQSPGGMYLISDRTGSAPYGNIYFFAGGAQRMLIAADGAVSHGPLTISGALSVGAINSTGDISTTSALRVGNSTVGYLYLGPPNEVQVIGSGGALYYRATKHNFQIVGGTAADIACLSIQLNGNVIANGNIQAFNAPATHAFVAPNIANPQGYGQAYAWTVYSSRDFKTAISPLEDPLAIVMNPNLHGMSYSHVGPSEATFEDGLTKEGKEVEIVQTPSIGFIADDWLPHVPEVVMVDSEGKPIGMDYDRVEAITFEAMKQLATQVGVLEGRIAALEGTSTT